MSDKSEPIVFVETGEPCRPNDFRACGAGGLTNAIGHKDPGVVDGWPGYRRLPAGWVAEACERAVRAMKERGYHLTVGDEAALVTALFPPPEVQPEEWEREAAEACWKASAALGRGNPIDTFARIIAAARANAKEKP